MKYLPALLLLAFSSVVLSEFAQVKTGSTQVEIKINDNNNNSGEILGRNHLPLEGRLS